MITTPDMRMRALFAGRQAWIAAATIYAAFIVWAWNAGYDWIDVPIAIPAMLGTALSILLGFRTASAYETDSATP